MIQFKNNLFTLHTKNTSYIFKVDENQKLIHLHFGPKLEDSERALDLHHILQKGSQVIYNKSDETSSMDTQLLEISEPQVGDFRVLSTDIWAGNQQATDFKFVDYEIQKEMEVDGLPRGFDSDQSLIVHLQDDATKIKVSLVYTLFYESDVITRFVEVINKSDSVCKINKLASLNLDMMNRQLDVTSFHGGWIKETHPQKEKLGIGRKAIASTTTSSSNRSNPGFLLSEKNATENHGIVYGVNLIYSGNHQSVIERTSFELIRITTGINEEQFEWHLDVNESFRTPSAVLTYSDKGFNGASQNFHHFINHHIIRKEFQNKERPITYNHWEGTFFDYNEKKLTSFAKQAAELGVELFVIDDGWFKNRQSDHSGLSNYEIDSKKFKNGLKLFVEKVKALGMKVGLWFEPEMISVDSDLYREHSEYALTSPNRETRFGRNQLVLDLCRSEVRDYIVNNVSRVLDENGIDYVKWDMNRHISDQHSQMLEHPKEFSHRYILGLYEVLERIFGPRPHILFESCSSGGNRFDLGMLSFSHQVWSSDNTDPIERLKIQEGLSYLYPLSTISAHVSAEVHQQTLRVTPLSTRFNVASFGVLGYELDLNLLNHVERKEIKEQIKWYKQHRSLFQTGTFYRHDKVKDNLVSWQVTQADTSCVGLFQTLAEAGPSGDRLVVSGLEEKSLYQVSAKPQRVMVERFGELIKHVSPVSINPKGTLFKSINKYYALADQKQEVIASGALLKFGLHLNAQFMGTGYHKDLRLWGDFGSTLYLISKREKDND